VAPGGDDHWSGALTCPNAARTDGPLATLEGARDRICTLRYEQKIGSGPIPVMIAAGTYPVSGPVVFSAVIMADNVQHLTLTDCRIEHTGIYGVWFRHGCTDCRIERCVLIDLGAGGVRIGETGISSKPADQTGRITMDNCIVHSGGRIFPGCIGVWIGQSSDNTITHNDIADLFDTAISVGWTT